MQENPASTDDTSRQSEAASAMPQQAAVATDTSLRPTDNRETPPDPGMWAAAPKWGVVAALINILIAWAIIAATQFLPPPVTTEMLTDSPAGLRPGSVAERSEVRALAVTATMVKNEYAIRSVALVFGFAIASVGFALFVMGVRGALHVSATQAAFGDVTVKAAAPGLACFLLATVLVGYTVSKYTVIPDPTSGGSSQQQHNTQQGFGRAEVKQPASPGAEGPQARSESTPPAAGIP